MKVAQAREIQDHASQAFRALAAVAPPEAAGLGFRLGREAETGPGPGVASSATSGLRRRPPLGELWASRDPIARLQPTQAVAPSRSRRDRALPAARQLDLTRTPAEAQD